MFFSNAIIREDSDSIDFVKRYFHYQYTFQIENIKSAGDLNIFGRFKRKRRWPVASDSK